MRAPRRRNRRWREPTRPHRNRGFLRSRFCGDEMDRPLAAEGLHQRRRVPMLPSKITTGPAITFLATVKHEPNMNSKRRGIPNAFFTFPSSIAVGAGDRLRRTIAIDIHPNTNECGGADR